MADLNEVLANLQKAALAEPLAQGVASRYETITLDHIGDHGWSSVTKRCVWCKGMSEIRTRTDSLAKYRCGAHAQDVWPHASIGDRETFISGTHSTCFTEMFPPDEEDDDEETM